MTNLHTENGVLIEWDPKNEAAADLASCLFDKYRQEGYKAYRVSANGVNQLGTVIDTFSANEGRYLLAAPESGFATQ